MTIPIIAVTTIALGTAYCLFGKRVSQSRSRSTPRTAKEVYFTQGKMTVLLERNIDYSDKKIRIGSDVKELEINSLRADYIDFSEAKNLEKLKAIYGSSGTVDLSALSSLKTFEANGLIYGNLVLPKHKMDKVEIVYLRGELKNCYASELVLDSVLKNAKVEVAEGTKLVFQQSVCIGPMSIDPGQIAKPTVQGTIIVHGQHDEIDESVKSFIKRDGGKIEFVD